MIKPKLFISSRNGALPKGGVERVVYYLEQILKKEYEVNIISQNYFHSGKQKNNKFTRLQNVIESSLYLRKMQKKGAVIISNGYTSPFVCADILFVHGTMYGFRKAQGITKFDPYTIFEQMAVQNSKHIAAVANHAKEECVEGYGVSSSKITVINNCVDTDCFFVKDKNDRTNLKIGFCGRLDEGKGIAHLLNLAKYMAEKGNSELYIATPSYCGTDIFDGLTNVNIAVNLTIEQLNDFYNSVDVIYLPSKYEGFEMITLEALSSGTPVVGYDVGAISELSREEFPGVLKIAPGTPDDEIKAINALAQKWRCKEEKQQLHDKIEQRCGIARYQQDIEALIHSVLL